MSKHYRLSLVIFLALLPACASIPIETQPAAIYKEGEQLFSSRNYDDAIAQYKKVRDAYASTDLSSNAELRIADAYFESERYIEAAAEYTQFRKLHPVHPKAPYALYRLALCHYRQITGTDTDQTPQKNCLASLDEFIARYPKSEYIPEVKQKRADVLMLQLQYELYVARFYYRVEKYTSAIRRLETALVDFPGNQLHDETWYLLGASQIKSGDVDKARTSFNKLSSQFPDSKYIVEAGRILEKYY